MLLFNFLCLFFLMVLTNSHTISKSIVKNDDIINVIDSVHDIEDDKEHDIKQNRYHHRHGFRAEPMKNLQTDSITSFPNDNPNFTIQASEHTDEVQVSKSRRKGFLRRLMDKIKRRKNKHLVTNGEIEQVRTTSWNIAAQKNLYVKNKTAAKVNDNSYTRPKRSHKNRKCRRKILSKRDNDPATNKMQSVIYDEDLFQNFKHISADSEIDKRKWSKDNDTWENNYQSTSMISYQPIIKKDNELSLLEMTTKINYLNEKYSIRPRPQNFTKYIPFLANSFNGYNLNQYENYTRATTLLKTDDFDKDLTDTDEIEDLLNIMKMRAVQIIANQNPVVTDIVSNSGAETVFEAVHSFKDMFSLGRAFSTGNYIPINAYDVTKLPSTVKTIMVRNIHKSPKQNTNVKREVVSNGEVLRKMYNNFKNQLSNEIKESQTALKNETKYWANKFTDKHPINCETTKNSASLLFRYKIIDDDYLGSNQNRDRKSILKHGKSKQITSTSTYAIPLQDNDYAMLTLYEKLLSKPHQDKIMIMSTTEGIKKRNAVENHVLHNRNHKIFSYLEDKEKDIGIPYKDVDPMDEYDEYESIQNEKPTEKFEPTTEKNKEPSRKTTTFKDLADKLSYNDYVNGYKHYLKFQKEQGAQNYSNLVRYQAHRHHSVDDIGKFILNKLPQVPERHKRAFYDESETTEDLDISTKNEESWFKKHFYLFIDSGQPKKFHSSETVSLRPPVAETDKVQHPSTENSIEKPSKMKARKTQKKIVEADLDRLSNDLEKYKNHPTPSTTTRQHYISNGYHTTLAEVTNYGTADVSVKFKDMIEKLFGGKKLRNAKPLSNLDYRDIAKRNMITEADIDLLLDNALRRSKRNTYVRDNNEYQLYHSYLPKEEIKPEKQFRSSDLSSPNSYKNYGYVDVNVITQPTAVVKLREAKNESKLKKFFKHLSFHFHKKKDKEIKKSNIHKRESLHRVQRSNPLKKLKEMFNVRIDGKPDTRSKVFDYDIFDTHLSSFKPFRHDKTSYLEDTNVEIPNVTEDVLYKTKTVANDSSYNAPVLKNSFLAKKYFQHNPVKYDLMTASDTYDYIGDPSEILIATKNNPQKAQVIPKINSSSKSKVKITPSDLINIRVTTVKTPKKHITYDMYDSVEAPFVTITSFDNTVEPIRKLSSVNETPNHILDFFKNINLRTTKKGSSIENKDNESDKLIISEYPMNELNSLPNIEINHEYFSPYNTGDVAIDEENSQETEAVTGNLKRQAKLSENPKNMISQNTKERKLTSFRHRYQTIPDYFKDFERWHNDLLHSENITTWQNILKDINHSYQYKPPNVTCLKKELSRIHKFLDINHDENIKGDNNRDRLKGIKKDMLTTKSATNIIKTKTAKAALTESRNLVKREGEANSNLNIYHNSNEGKFDTHQNYSKTNSETKNLSRTVSEKYHKLIHPMSHNVQIEDSSKIDKASKGTTTPIINTDNAPENTYFMDTSLLAYDDGFNFMTEKVAEANDEPTLQSSLNMHAIDAVNSVTKLHKVPEQYFSTPLPMERKDFDKFLKENDLDVISVTSPLSHSSRKTITKNDRQRQYDSTLFINFKNLPEQYNKLKQSLKMSKPLEFKNMSENTKDGNFDSISVDKVGKEYNMGSKVESENTFIDRYNYNINRGYDDIRRKRATFKSSQPEEPTAGSLGYGIYSKYHKLKDHFKNFDRKDEETKDTMRKTSNILNEVEDTVIDYDNLEDPQFENTKAKEQSNIKYIKGESTTKDEEFNKSLRKDEKKPLHQNVTIKQFKHKTHSTKKGPAESEKQLKTNATHKMPGKVKPQGNYPMHNNLLFNYMFSDGQRQKVNIPNESINGTTNYILTNDNHHNYEGPIKMLQNSRLSDPNIRVEKSSNPKRIQITSNTYKYDIIYEDDFSDKHNVNNKETTTQRLQVFGQHGFYSMKVNGSANDSENEKIIQLVKVVEAVENYTRPNVLIRIDLPTYYLPNTDQTELAPIQSPPKSIWNDYILKYVSGIALIELLTKFGILKTVETNLTDGMDENVNACGVFSGAAEPRLAMDLMLGNGVRRVQRSQKDSNSTSRSLRKTTSEPIRRGTLIYDLKQMDRPNNHETKQRRGPFKSLHGTSVLSLLQKQRQMRLNETKRTPTSKSSDKPPTENQTETSSTTAKSNCTVTNISGNNNGKNPHENLQNKDVKNTNESVRKSFSHEEKNKTNGVERTLPVKEDLKTKATITPKMKCSKSVKAKNHTTNTFLNGNEKETSKSAVTTHKKANVKDFKTKKHQHLTIITKIYSDKKQKLSDYEFVFPNTKILPTKAEMTSVIAKVTSGPNEEKTEITKEKYTTTKATSSTQNVSSTTKGNAVVTFIPEIGTMFSQSELDLKAPADEDSFYVTSNNYYDYHTGDLEYNLNESKVVKIENTTKMKNDSALKHDKRDIKSQNTFTAKDVAAIEVIVDLMRNSRNSAENELVDTINENTGTTLSDPGQASSRVNDIASNSIQVHIAIPYNLSNEKRRSLYDPVKIRKVFSAKLSTPVDMEYQIHSAEGLESSSSESDISTSSSTSTLSATSLKMDALSPGMYLLEENMNNLMPKGKYILRPIYNKRFLSDCKIRQAVTKSIITHKVATATPPNNLAKVTLSKDFIAALDQHLLQLYRNLTSAPEHKINARNINLRKILKHKHYTYRDHRPRRHINWDTIKKYFGHDRVCNCHCKPNRTMCRACAASDAVISELIFELDNLAQYMNDHCTEIQTYFWMNPSGGRKLREAVQRIDKTLYNYYKRVKGKCKGRPCKAFTYMDKRDFVNFDKRVNYIGEPLIRDIEKIADDLEQASKFNIGDDSLAKTGIKCLDVITKCMHLKPFNKRADESIGNKNRLRNVYSLDNVNVNIICKTDSQMDKTQNNICLSTLTSTYLTESPSIFYYDLDEFKNEQKQKTGIKSFLSRKSNMKKKRKNKSHLFTYYVTPTESRVNSNNMRLKKRQISNNQIESPLITDTGGLFWFDYINGNKNKNQYVEERSNKDNNYNFQSNHDFKENNDNITKTENSTDYEYSSYENSSVNDINQNDLTESTNTFISFMINNNVSQFTTQNMQTTKTKSKKSRLTNITNKIIDVNQSKSIKHRIKELLELLDADDFGSFEDTPFSGLSIQNKNKTSFVEKLETQKHRKRKIFYKTFQKHTKEVTPSTTTTMNTSILFQPTSKNTEITTKKVNVTRRSYLSRFKEATLKFLDKLDGTNNFIIDEKTTTPIYVYGKKSTVNNRAITNLLLNRKRDLKSSKVNTDDVAVDRDIRGDAINIRDNNMSDDEQLKDNLDLISNSLERVKNSNKNKELLLSILDFETNKLNDEWTRIEKRKTAVEDSKNNMDDVGQIIFQLHSDFDNIVPEKTTETKVDCTTTESLLNQTIASQSNNITNTTKKNNTTTDSKGGCGKCYDIVKDMRGLELTVPPELTSTRAYNGFLDKFIHKFAFKNVPNSQKKKAVKSHLNAPKERSLRGKMEHGKRHRDKVHCKTKPNKNGTDIEDLEQPPSSLNTFTVTNEATKIKTTVNTTSKSPKTTTSTTEKSARKTTESEIGNDATTPDHSEKNIGTTNDKNENEEVYEPNAQPTKYICDIDATVGYIQEMFHTLSKNDFGKYVKNISCFKYKKAPSAFHIKATSMQSKKKLHCKTGHINTDLSKKILKWNWIRDKRSSQPNSDAFGDFTNRKDFDNDYFDDVDDESKGFEVENLRGNLQYALRDEKEDYDRLYLDGDGVYRKRGNERKKRGAVDMTDVVNGLRNLPPLRPLIDEIFVIRGDSVTIQCNASGSPLYSYSNLSNLYQYTWSAERKAMLQCSNTKVFGPTISIVNVQPRNFGTYTCFKDKSVIRSVKLNVIVVPDFNVVFTPLYKCQSECTYEDLKNIQKLGPVMSKAMSCRDDEPCPIRIDEPVCMSNKENEDLLKPTVVMKPSPQPTIECSPECQRDLKCSLALLWASNAPSLALVKVIISYDELNKTLTPFDTCDSDLSTVIALKKKDSNGHHEYRRLVLSMEPGNVDVVVTCPAGFYLLADQKICAVCPVDTCSLAGENTCSACPRGTRAPPGASACRLAFSPHSCVSAGVPGCLSAAQAQGRVRRPLSPSRVLLERLFKRSPSSSRATDSQETRFGMWKERNGPPPLPPIDFDL